MLAEGLTDALEHVRIAAARALERQHNDMLLSGIKNLLVQDDTQATHIVVAFLQAEADTLCMRLINDYVATLRVRPSRSPLQGQDGLLLNLTPSNTDKIHGRHCCYYSTPANSHHTGRRILC